MEEGTALAISWGRRLRVALATACVLLTCLTFALTTTVARAQTTVSFSVGRYQPDIPWGGQIGSVVALPGDDSMLAAAATVTGGVYLSSTSGSSWSHEDSLSAGDIQSLSWMTAADGLGWGCPCLLATSGPDYKASGEGGLYVASGVALPHRWQQVAGVFPASSSSCDARTRSAHDLSIAPDTHQIYVGTDCGIAIGTPRTGGSPSWRLMTIPGAADQHIESLLALPGNRIIAGGPAMGVWYYDGTSWNQSTGFPSGGSGIFWVHALAADPRGTGCPGCAYVETELSDRPVLSETTDGGMTWHQIAITFQTWGGTTQCGGIANVHAVLAAGALQLYAGDKCRIYHAPVPIQSQPYQVLQASDWSTLDPGGHSDTWDVAFHSASGLPFAVASDGGVDISSDGSTFSPVGAAHGLDALQITEITGQIPIRSATPDLYFATWHDSLWSMAGTSATPANSAGAEGFGFGMAPMATGTTDKITATFCDSCANNISSPHFMAGADWGNAEGTVAAPVSSPTFVSPGHYVQAVDDAYPATRRAGLAFSVSTGARWRQIAYISSPLYGLPKVAGPVSDPTVTQPYLDAGLTMHDPAGRAVVHLASIQHLNAFSPPSSGTTCRSTSRNCNVPSAMRGFGGLGVTPANTPFYEVYGQDPSDPNRIFAPDAFDGHLKRSMNLGDDWRRVPAIDRLTTQHGALLASLPCCNQRQVPNVSVVSVCPYNGSRLLIGTHEGGAYFSFDSGDHWATVTGSSVIRYATSIYWLPGCAAAYVGTFGSGLFRIHFNISTDALGRGCQPPICRLEQILGQRIRQPHPLPSAARGLIVSDGYIRRIQKRNGGPIITVTAGSVVTPFRSLPRKTRLVTAPTISRDSKAKIQAAFFVGGRAIRVLRGQPLRLYPYRYGHPGKGLAHSPKAPAAELRIAAEATLNGNAYVQVNPAKPLTVDATIAKPTSASLLFDLDGQTVAKYGPGAKSFHYQGQLPAAMFAPNLLVGMHNFELLSLNGNRTTVLASNEFIVPNSDGEDEAAGLRR